MVGQMMSLAKRSVFGLSLLLPSAIILVVVWWRWPCRRLWRLLVSTTHAIATHNINHHDEDTKKLRQNIEVQFSIPDRVVGYVIGRQGTRVRQIEEETGARVRFKERLGSRDKVVHVCQGIL